MDEISHLTSGVLKKINKIFNKSVYIFIIIIALFSCKGNINIKRDKDIDKNNDEKVEIKNIFPKPIGIINDYSHLFTDSQKITLGNILYYYEIKTTRQIVIVTVDSINPYMDIQRFATALGNAWGVGNAKKNNGVVFVICKPCHKVAIATGTGTEKQLPNNVVKEIIDNVIIPKFRTGEFYNGTLNGIKEIINKWDSRSNQSSELKLDSKVFQLKNHPHANLLSKVFHKWEEIMIKHGIHDYVTEKDCQDFDKMMELYDKGMYPMHSSNQRILEADLNQDNIADYILSYDLVNCVRGSGWSDDFIFIQKTKNNELVINVDMTNDFKRKYSNFVLKNFGVRFDSINNINFIETPGVKFISYKDNIIFGEIGIKEFSFKYSIKGGFSYNFITKEFKGIIY